jgi:hypothetical protein
VDLGFVDVKHHHSKSSGYYQESGEETYDFTKSANTSLIVPGNFRPTVNTKHEFKVSKQVIEQVTSAKPKGQEFYNCSDGARIKGTLPIRPDELLIVVTEQQKVKIVEKLKTMIFSKKGLGNYLENFEAQFSHDLLMEELAVFKTLLKKKLTSSDDVEKVINKQKELLFASYKNGKSLLFYYLYGTVNYANAVLTKSLYSQNTNSFTPIFFNNVRKKWVKIFHEISTVLKQTNLENFDTSSFRAATREIVSLKLNATKERLLVVTDSLEFRNSILKAVESRYNWLSPLDILTPEESINYQHSPSYSLYFLTQEHKSKIIKGNASTLVISDTADTFNIRSNDLTFISFLKKKRDETHFSTMALIALKISQSAHKCALIIPKSKTIDASKKYRKQLQYAAQHELIAYNYPMYVCVYQKNSVTNEMLLSRNGSRGKRILGKLQITHLVH